MVDCYLRPVRDSDHQFLVDLHNDPRVLHNLTNPQPVTLKQHMLWWEKISKDDSQIRLIYEIDNTPIGFTKFYNIDRNNNNCVLGADIHKDHRGQGYAQDMWSLMLNYCFQDLALHRVSLTTAEYNVIGQKVYKKLGFKEEGRFIKSLLRDGYYYDQILMYMLASDWIIDE